MSSLKRIKKKPEIIVLSIIFLFRIVYFLYLDYVFTPDSSEYISRDGFAWLHGSVDRYRLPVYPMLIDLCQFISEAYYSLVVCIVQLLISLLSIVVLYWTLKKLTDKKGICLLVTFLYGTMSATSGWDKTLLTESLSLSLTVFIIFGIVSYIKDKKYRYIIITTICLIISSFLKAVFTIYAGMFFVFLILITIFPGKHEEKSTIAKLRKVNLKSALISFIPIIFICAYAFTFNNLYGGFTLSDSGLGQQVYVVVASGYYKDSTDTEIKEIAEYILNTPSNCTVKNNLNGLVSEFYKDFDVSNEEKEQIKEQMLSLVDNTLNEPTENWIDEFLDMRYDNLYNCDVSEAANLARFYIMGNFDRDRVAQFVSEAKMNNLSLYITKIVSNLFYRYESISVINGLPLSIWVTSLFENLLFFLEFSIIHSLIISLIEIVIFLVALIKKKKTDWIRLGLGVYVLATIFLSVFGTNADFARTAITSIPFMFVAIAMYIDSIYKYLFKRDT